jgi:hypothetical protein
MRSRLAMRQLAICSIGDEFRTHCQRVVHAGLAAPLVGIGGFAGDTVDGGSELFAWRPDMPFGRSHIYWN